MQFLSRKENNHLLSDLISHIYHFITTKAKITHLAFLSYIAKIKRFYCTSVNIARCVSKLVLSYTHFLCSIDLCHLVYPPAFSIWCSCGSWGDFDGGNKTSVTELTVLRKVASIAIIAFSAKVSGSKTLQIKFEPKQVGSLRCIGKSLPE